MLDLVGRNAAYDWLCLGLEIYIIVRVNEFDVKSLNDFEVSIFLVTFDQAIKAMIVHSVGA